MNKSEFMRKLDQYLSGTREGKAEILADYEEHFQVGLAEGLTEEKIAASLGDPRAIAKSYNAEVLVAKAQTDRTAGNILRAIIAVVSLSFFNLIFVLGIFFGLLGALIGLWAAGISITVSGLAVFLAALISPVVPWVASFGGLMTVGMVFVGLGLLALGLLSCIGLSYVTMGAYKLTVAYLQFNLRIIKGEK